MNKNYLFPIIFVLVCAGFIAGMRWYITSQQNIEGQLTNNNMTLNQLHKLNLDGKLNESQGVVYNGISFVKKTPEDAIWHSQIPYEGALISVSFHNNPAELEKEVRYSGLLVAKFFEAREYYLGFNPEDDQRYTAMASGKLVQMLSSLTGKKIHVGCNKEYVGCEGAPIVTCDYQDNKRFVFQITQEEGASVEFNKNCVTFRGEEEEIVMAVEWYIYKLMGVYS